MRLHILTTPKMIFNLMPRLSRMLLVNCPRPIGYRRPTSFPEVKAILAPFRWIEKGDRKALDEIGSCVQRSCNAGAID